MVYGAAKLDAAAKLLGISNQTLSKDLNQVDNNGLWISRAASLEEFFDSDGLAECFAARRGGLFVKLPSVPEGADPGVVQRYSQVVKEFAEFSAAIGDALGDGKLDAAEVRKFQKELRDVYTAGEHLVREALASLGEKD